MEVTDYMVDMALSEIWRHENSALRSAVRAALEAALKHVPETTNRDERLLWLTSELERWAEQLEGHPGDLQRGWREGYGGAAAELRSILGGKDDWF